MWVGAALGLAASVALGPLLSRWLFGIAPVDVPTIAGALLAVIVVAVIATYVPASRAARADPQSSFALTDGRTAISPARHVLGGPAVIADHVGGSLAGKLSRDASSTSSSRRQRGVDSASIGGELARCCERSGCL